MIISSGWKLKDFVWLFVVVFLKNKDNKDNKTELSKRVIIGL